MITQHEKLLLNCPNGMHQTDRRLQLRATGFWGFI